jgi:hypothetical protein
MGMQFEQDPEKRPEEEADDIGASDDSASADTLPAAPADDDAPLGDTDQHSDA